MASSVLPPPSEATSPPASSPPPLPRLVPLRREHPSGPPAFGSRRTLVLSGAMHAVAIVFLSAVASERVRPAPDPTTTSDAPTVWIDIGPFPGVGSSAAPVAAAEMPAPDQNPRVSPGGSPVGSTSVNPVPPQPLGAGARVRAVGPASPPATGGSGGGATARPRGGAAGNEGAGPTGGASAGRIGGGWRDPRLIPTPRELPPDRKLSDHERYMAQLADQLGVYNDSVAADAERARRSTDWTRTDKNGKKWGVSPGKIHLGGITLPAPERFSPPPGQEEEIERRARQRAEIDRQVDDAERRKALEEQNRATRERRDRERAARDDGS